MHCSCYATAALLPGVDGFRHCPGVFEFYPDSGTWACACGSCARGTAPTGSVELEFKPGDRVELVSCTDPYTDLSPGSRGTVSELGLKLELGEPKLHVLWDSGSTLSLLPTLGDEVKKVEGAGCPNCGGTKTSWELAKFIKAPAMNGALWLQDVGVNAVLGCDECSETIKIEEVEL